MSNLPSTHIPSFKIKEQNNIVISFSKSTNDLFSIYHNEVLLNNCKANNIESLIDKFFIKLARVNSRGKKFKKENIYYPKDYVYNLEDILTILGFNQDNLIILTKKQLNMTYKQLASALGMSTPTLTSISSQNVVSNRLKKTIELYIENLELKNKLNKMEAKYGKFIEE